jgi:sulfur-carrier protein
VTLLYFAWVRQKIGVAEETMALPEGVATVADLAAHLRARGEGYADALSDMTRVSADDEVAFFPPVTGG